MPSHASLRKWVFLPTIWNVLFWTRNNYSFPHWFHPFPLEKYQLVQFPLFLRGHVPEQLCLVHLLFQEQHQYLPSALTTPWKHDFLISKACSAQRREHEFHRVPAAPFWIAVMVRKGTPGQDALLACSNYRSYKQLNSVIFFLHLGPFPGIVSDWDLVVVEA